MITRFLLVIAACLSITATWGQAGPELIVYHNRGSVTNQTVHADIFINDGLFEVQNLFQNSGPQQIIDPSLTPYDLSYTRWFTNNGIFQGLSLRLDYVDDFANKMPMESWVNTTSGRIDLADGFHYGTAILNQQTSLGFWYAPYSSIRINSKYIRNEGLIRIGAGGLLRVGATNTVTGLPEAETVDLSDGILAVDPLGYIYGGTNQLTLSEGLLVNGNYINPLGIYDYYWGMGTLTNQDASTLMLSVNPNFVVTPEHTVSNQFGTRLTTAYALPSTKAFGFTITKLDLTNIIIQAVFVQTADTNVQADVRWYPITEYPDGFSANANDFWTPFVQLSAVVTNALTLQTELSTLYIWDQIARSTNNNVVDNDKFPFFRRPNNYFLSRNDYGYFSAGLPADFTNVSPGLFYQLGFSNQIVTNFYAGYAFSMENLVYNVPNLPDVGVKDLPGRVEVYGQNVNLERTGMRGEGLVSINSSNLLSSVGTVVDAQNLTFNLATTTTNTLRFENLAKNAVSRFHGGVTLWSGVWTNQFGDANSNVFNLLYHVLMVDASGLSSVKPVSVAEFQARAETVSIHDNMIVSNKFTTTATNLTILGNVELRNIAWSSTNLPNVRNFTNEATGSLTLQGLSDFGINARPWSNFVNRGTIASYSSSIVADNVENYGKIFSAQNTFLLFIDQFGLPSFTNFFGTNSGPIYVDARKQARLEVGDIATYGGVFLKGPIYKFNNFNISSGGAINMDVTEALQDAGVGSGNVFRASNMFSLNLPVPTGSLLGTEIHAEPAPRGVFDFRWAQPAPADTTITNIPTAANWVSETNDTFNAWKAATALGELVLHSNTNSIFEFHGTTANRALLVDLIVIDGSGITNLNTLTNLLKVFKTASAGIDIYYGDIVATNLSLNLGFQSLAEWFNGRTFTGGGSFRWVPTFNGPRSSEDVVTRVVQGGTTNLVTVRMNRALRHSRIIDMDGDGIANADDDLPLRNEVGAITISSISLTTVNGQAAVQFAAYPGTYTLQYADSLTSPVNWKVAATYQHTASTASMKTLADTTPTPTGQRFYRLTYRQ